jgi:putative protease
MNGALPTSGLVPLPLLQPDNSEVPNWNGLAPVEPPPDAPEPIAPQGAYGDTPAEWLQTPEVGFVPSQPVELLAPAGGLDAAFAAFHFGADAIYLGLKKFSARAEADNFALEEVSEIIAYAHSLSPRRRVFVTVNTLIRQDELAELVEAVASLADANVDALIIQDLGVYHLVRRHFPGLELHASTQLSVHNRAGAEALHKLGFKRVVLARELTFEEVRDITATAGIETEVFIHGALCYSYSGLCLFSSQTLGRSGNRGKCAYSCRDSYEVSDAPLTLRDGSKVKRDPRQGFPFSMKDLALPDHIPALRAAGVSCFKIEGRKKSPLYVATTTDYYRGLIDGRLGPDERPAHEADMQTVFSRPWTRLFVHSHKDKEVADRDTVGHRGTLIGRVEALIAEGSSDARLRFRTNRALERHDGLQIDLPILGKPFGFAVDRLWIVAPGRRGKRTEEFAAEAGSLVEVGLPADHPEISKDAPVYCSSSQAVKQRYRHERPKPGQYRVRKRLGIEMELSAKELRVTGRVLSRETSGVTVEASRCMAGQFTPARDPAGMAETARAAFAKLGDTELELASFTIRNDDALFVPVSRLNQLRREITAELQDGLLARHAERIAHLQTTICPPLIKPTPTRQFRWSIKVDRVEFLTKLEDADLQDVDEIVIDIARDHPALLQESLSRWAARLGRDRVRLALPSLTRSWEDKGIRHKIEQFRSAGWSKWEAANLSAWSYLHAGDLGPLDLATDWSVYVLNRLAVEQLITMGVTRFALSPEDGLQNIRSLLSEYARQAVVIIHQDTPQFLAESCAYANLIGGCPGKANCRFESMDMVSSHGERVTALDYHCRTIVLNQGPFCISNRLADLARAGALNLRADFIYRKYEPIEVRDRWRLVRAGKTIPGGLAANFDRGIL